MGDLLKKINKFDLNNSYVDMTVLNKISQDVVYGFCILPFNIIDNKLCVAATDDLNETAINYLKFIYKVDVKVYFSTKKDIYFAIEKYYKKESLYKAIDELKNVEKINETQYIGYSNDSIEEAPAVKITNLIIDEAVNMNASDIHIEPFASSVLVRFRIDGVLLKYMEIPKDVYPFICTRIKIMSNMDISKKFIPGDGKIHYELNDEKYDFRVSSIPTIYGEKIVIRILNKGYEKITLDKLGFNIESYKEIKKILKSSSGMILVTGPTGSGKTTTLYSLLNELNKQKSNITTIEDPVEYNMDYINQININNKAGMSFASVLRSLLRQDPDVIMVGEIRDAETAKIAVRAGMTGHLVFSTLHTRDSASTILRLMDMGVEDYLLADTLLAIISQRLVRKICTCCKQIYIPGKEEREYLNLSEEQSLYKGKGCAQCNNTGYMSRTVVWEIMKITEKQKDLIRNKSTLQELRKCNLKYGMRSLKSNAVSLVTEGITTYEEIISKIE